VQAEDELAAINMIIGAAFTGVRSMTATSGPGQALMTEAIGLAASLEIPIVIVECARTGPSTGMPTKTEQSNLNHLIFGGHGEIPRVVLAPGTVEDSFYLGDRRSNLAEKYQMPVFILTEQALCQSKATLPPLSSAVEIDRGKAGDRTRRVRRVRRFAFTEDHVSPRVIPGVEGGMHLAAGLGTQRRRRDHREPQEPQAHDGKAHGQDRDDARPDLPAARLTRRRRCRHSGSSATAATAVRSPKRRPALNKMGEPVRFLQLRTLWPFPDDDVARSSQGAQHVFVVENNYTGQLERLIRAVVGPLDALHGVRKYNGRPFRPIEIIDADRARRHARSAAGGQIMAMLMSPKDFATATPSWWCPGCGDYGVLSHR
jgi:2-oxoglutarate ferredoxin oxidoreductase subunit alpha